MRNLIAIIGFIVAFLVSSAAFGAQAVISWTDNSDNETGFKLDRQLNGGPWATLPVTINANVTSVTDTTVVQPTVPGSADNVYCYRLLAFNKTGNSPFTNTACKTFAAPASTVPNAPSGLTTAQTLTPGAIDLTWKNNEAQYWLTTTEILRRTQLESDSDKLFVLAGWRTTFRDTEVGIGTRACYRAWTIKADKKSAQGNESCATAR